MSALGAVILLCASAVNDGRIIHDFAAIDQNGHSCRLSDYDAAPVIVVIFLGTECPLAKLYSPRLNELSREFQERGVIFLGINSNAGDTPDDVARFARQQELRFPLLRDADGKVANPDPDALFRYGKRTTDEMFHGYFDGVMLDRKPARSIANLLATVTLTIGYCVAIRQRRRGATLSVGTR